jgi:dTDP-4-dehydrorhamnose reductase
MRNAERGKKEEGGVWSAAQVSEIPHSTLRTPHVAPPLPLLITGIAGVAGYNALDYFQRKYPGRVIGIRQQDNWRLVGEGIVACNAEDHDGLARLFDRHRFAAVLDCAGNCALKSCELDPDMAWRINVEGVRNLLNITAGRNVRLVHLSIDLVFSGTASGGHVETDATDPVTVYGQTMVAAEELLLAERPDACILRISLPMGISFNGHAGAIDWIQSRFKKSKPATLYFDEIRTPTYTDCLNRLCEAVLSQSSRHNMSAVGSGSEAHSASELPQHRANGTRSVPATLADGARSVPAALTGLYHAGGPRRLSLFQIAQIVNRVGGYDPRLLMGCPRRQAGPIPPRAGDVSMNSMKLSTALGYDPFDPWPLEDQWVPTDPQWHFRRSPSEPGSSEVLARILYRNPSLRHTDAA